MATQQQLPPAFSRFLDAFAGTISQPKNRHRDIRGNTIGAEGASMFPGLDELAAANGGREDPAARQARVDGNNYGAVGPAQFDPTGSVFAQLTGQQPPQQQQQQQPDILSAFSNPDLQTALNQIPSLPAADPSIQPTSTQGDTAFGPATEPPGAPQQMFDAMTSIPALNLEPPTSATPQAQFANTNWSPRLDTRPPIQGPQVGLGDPGYTNPVFDLLTQFFTSLPR